MSQAEEFNLYQLFLTLKLYHKRIKMCFSDCGFLPPAYTVCILQVHPIYIEGSNNIKIQYHIGVPTLIIFTKTRFLQQKYNQELYAFLMNF